MPVAPTLERKTVPLRGLEIRQAEGAWEVAGYASTFAAPDAPLTQADYYGDLVMRGAFAKSIADRETKLFLEHSTAIGRQLELKEDRHGLYGRWSIVDSTSGTDAYKLAKAGVLDALSIGFFATRTEPRSDGARLIYEAEVVEVSLVGVGANPNAKVTDVKSGAIMPTAPARPVDLAATRTRLAALGVDVSRRHENLGARVAADRQLKAFASGQLHRAVVALDDVDVRALVSAPIAATELAPLGTSAPLRSALSFLPQLTTQSGLVSVTSSTGGSGALAVAQATAASGVTGTKPEITVGYSATNVSTVQVAGWVSATRRALADASSLAQIIDGDVRGAVTDALTLEVLSGSGTPPSMRGISLWPGIGTATATPGSELAGLMTAIGRVVTASRQQPSVCFISLESWAALIATPAVLDALGPSMLLPGNVELVPTSGLVAGTALVGVPSTAPVYYQTGIVVEAGYVGSDFTRNLVRLRGEVLAVVGVSKPSAWCRVDGLGTGA